MLKQTVTKLSFWITNINKFFESQKEDKGSTSYKARITHPEGF